MKVIVTGGLGYVGRVLIEELEKAKVEPIVIDGNLFNLATPKDKYINCDILDKGRMGEIFDENAKPAKAVIHLAAIVGDHACLADTRKAIEVNCAGTRNVVELANKHNMKVFLASTCSLYGAEKCSTDSPLTEESHTFPVDFYGQTKYQQERFVTELAKDFCVLRLGTAYGLSPRMRYDLVINMFSAKAANKELITVYGGTQYRPFTHIRDIARAFVHALKKDLSGVYNLSGENVALKDVAQDISKRYGIKAEITELIQDPRNYIVDNKKLRSTGFEFKWNLEKGIDEMVKFSKDIDYREDIYNNRKLMQAFQLDESKILITGGDGGLGNACRKIMPNAQYTGRKELDLQDGRSIDNYFKNHKVETVIHLAAFTGIPPCENDPEKAYDVNVEGTRRILESAKSHGVRHFIYMSTACVFPGTDGGRMEDEDSIPYPKHFYGLSKLMGEEITKSYNSPEMQTTVARTNFTTMPWEYPKAFTDRFGTYLFAQGVAKGLKDLVVYRPKNQVIHVCGDRKISMYEYAKAGGSKVEPMTMADYNGPPLTKNMCLTSKCWKLYRLEDSDYNDS